MQYHKLIWKNTIGHEEDVDQKLGFQSLGMKKSHPHGGSHLSEISTSVKELSQKCQSIVKEMSK